MLMNGGGVMATTSHSHRELPQYASPRHSRIANSLIAALWVVLGLLLLSLVTITAILFNKINLLSSRTLTDPQSKSLWAFLGVALSALVALIGTLLTAQHNLKQIALAKESENRLTLDTIVKTLGLISVNGEYAKRAQIAGAIAAMMQLGGGVVALRVLGELWNDEKIDTDTAVWLIDRVPAG